MAAWGALKEESPDSYFVTITWVLNTGVTYYCRQYRCILSEFNFDLNHLCSNYLILTAVFASYHSPHPD
jgi:hypothetical protein